MFPEDEATKPNLKLLASAKAWKRKMAESEDEDEAGGNDGENQDKGRYLIICCHLPLTTTSSLATAELYFIDKHQAVPHLCPLCI